MRLEDPHSTWVYASRIAIICSTIASSQEESAAKVDREDTLELRQGRKG